MQDLRWILEALPVGVWVGKVPDGQVAYANPEFRRISGMDAVAESTMGDASTTYGVFDRQGRPYPVERLPFSRVVAHGDATMVDDMVIHRPDGRKVNLRSFGYPVFDAERKLTHVVVAVIDITKEVKAEVEREATEARLSFAVNHAPIAIWSADRDGVIKVSEGAGLAALGVRSGDLVGMSIFDLYKDHPIIPGYVRRGLRGESFWSTVQIGEAVYETWLTPVRDAAGVITGVAGLSNDVSEIRKLQAKVIQNDRVIALGTLAASVAHEINNPLTYMLGHARLLQDALGEISQVLSGPQASQHRALLDLVERMHRLLEPVSAGTERIATITRELRTFSRPEADESTIVDIRTVVRSVLQLVGKELETRARLVVELGETAPVRGQQAKFVQVILNLVVNAMQALPDNRPEDNEVTVRSRNEGDKVVIEVGDSGPGVAAKDRERIFEPFVSTKDIGQGTGLGLFVCRNIVRGFSGDVAVGDRSGGGAVFRVTLPASTGAPETALDRVASVSSSHASGHVLIIDDEPMVARALGQQLASAGYRVTTEQDAEGAVDLLARDEGTIDLVFCDLMMKRMTGMDLSEALKIRNPAALAKMVFMTGGAFTPRARAFMDDHPDQVVDKPFDVVAEADRRLRRLRE